MAKDGVYIGNITLRGGTSLVSTELHKISVMEIGGRSLRDVRASQLMLNYVDRATERHGIAAVGIHRNAIIAVGQHGVTVDALEPYDEAMKTLMKFFWVLIICATLTLFLAPISIPFGLWTKFSFLPRERRKIFELILAVEAATNKVTEKESTN